MDDFGSPAVPTEDDIVLVKIKGQVFKFLASKNQIQEGKYDLSFFSVISLLAVNNVVSTVDANQQRHPKHKKYVVEMPHKGELFLYEVPFLEEPPNTFFLKTFYPSRKMKHKIWGEPRKSKRLKKMLSQTPDIAAVSVEITSIALSIKEKS